MKPILAMFYKFEINKKFGFYPSLVENAIVLAAIIFMTQSERLEKQNKTKQTWKFSLC